MRAQIASKISAGATVLSPRELSAVPLMPKSPSHSDSYFVKLVPARAASHPRTSPEGHLVDPLAVDQCTRSQISVLICFSFGEFVRTIIVSLLLDNWNSRTKFPLASPAVNVEGVSFVADTVNAAIDGACLRILRGRF